MTPPSRDTPHTLTPPLYTPRRAENLISSDETGTSDPYIQWAIRPNRALWYRKGGAFGRSARTAVMYNTLFPEKLTSLSPLYYYGTRAELENELLHIQVCAIGNRGGDAWGGPWRHTRD